MASRVDRHDTDIVNLTVSINALRERIDYQHTAVVGKLDNLQSAWIDRFSEHARQDLLKDEQILREVNAAKTASASLRNYIIGIGVCIPVIIEILNFMLHSGLLRHG
jgi:hypothetical protein